MFNILVLNLGGTSTKVAVFRDTQVEDEYTFRHSDEDISRLPLSAQQLEYREDLVKKWLKENGHTIERFDAVAVRGATIREANRSGTYLVKGFYKELLMELFIPEQPLVNGIRIVTPLALNLVGDLNIPIYITDPPSVDELQPIAKVSGLVEYERRGRFHALNQRAVARKHAQSLGKSYKECRLIVAHMGGGISVGAHQDGVVIDVNDAGDGYGPFSPDRAGTVSTEAMLDMCFNKKLSYQEVYRHIRGEAGIFAHLGTKDIRIVEQRIKSGDKKARLIFDAMVYQVAKEIGSCAAVLKGKADAILLTGGISYSEMVVSSIKNYVEAFAPVTVYPGEYENEALAAGALRILNKEEEPIILVKK
jgi:butyrate kinase